MYIISLFTRILLYLPSELAHTIALNGLKLAYISGILKFLLRSNADFAIPNDSKSILNAKNTLGIAAGLDKNGDYIDCLAALGIGFLEVGTVTPQPQKGNPKPRIFRDLKDKSILNRLGFNNKGVNYLAERLKRRKSHILVGTSIGKNFDTSNEEAYKDYIFCLEKVYEFSDYLAVNISSPNTLDLRDLSKEEYLKSLLNKIKLKQNELAVTHGYKPVLLKISPDEEINNLRLICEVIMDVGLDGLICTNTSVMHKNPKGKGGLSGAPLKDKSTEVLTLVKNLAHENLLIIASGGVMSVDDFQEKMNAGADLVQVYTGFIYKGPQLIQDINRFASSKIKT